MAGDPKDWEGHGEDCPTVYVILHKKFKKKDTERYEVPQSLLSDTGTDHNWTERLNSKNIHRSKSEDSHQKVLSHVSNTWLNTLI